jgi:hypothetical protein
MAIQSREAELSGIKTAIGTSGFGRHGKSLLIVAALLILGAVSIYHLREPYHSYIWVVPFEGFRAVWPTTAWAAARVWIFWSLTTIVAGLVLLRLDAKLAVCDAIIGGAACTWIFAYIAGNLLGPIGLFRSWTIWLTVIVVVLWIARDPPAIKLTAPTTGQKLALLACLLMVISELPLELGSPVSPYMDALNLPASVQRILTFHSYLPLDDDPYGYWGPMSQTPAASLLFAFLGLGAHLSLGVLAVTAAMVPMAALIIFATYRLGRTLMDDIGGGMAALLIFATTLLVRAQHLRGTPIAFAILAIGLAFFLDRDRSPIKTAIGALALGTAFATQAIDGAFAFATAGSVVLVRLLDDNPLKVILQMICLAGAALVALPEISVGLAIKVPYPIIPLVQIIGILLIWFGAVWMTPLAEQPSRPAGWTARAIVLLTLIIFATRPPGVFHALATTFPTLLILCIAGLVTALIASRPKRVGEGIYVAAIGLLLARLAEYLLSANLFSPTSGAAQFGVDDVIWKLNEYWGPYCLIFPAAVLFAWLYWNVSRPLAAAALVVLLVYPWAQHPELDIAYNEHSIAEGWARDWYCAKIGWWTTLPDHRWLQNPSEMDLSAALRKEIAAGRITSHTHIVHVTPKAIIWQDVLLHSVYTGIDDDIYVIHPDGDLTRGAYANSRMRPISDLPQALASNPPYVVSYNEAQNFLTLPAGKYQEIFTEDGIHLFRRSDLAPRNNQTGKD